MYRFSGFFLKDATSQAHSAMAWPHHSVLPHLNVFLLWQFKSLAIQTQNSKAKGKEWKLDFCTALLAPSTVHTGRKCFQNLNFGLFVFLVTWNTLNQNLIVPLRNTAWRTKVCERFFWGSFISSGKWKYLLILVRYIRPRASEQLQLCSGARGEHISKT